MRRQSIPTSVISGVLPAAGAEDVSSAFNIPPSAKTVTIWMIYTRASVTGYPRFQFRWVHNSSALLYQGVTISGTDLVQEFWDWTGANDAAAVQMCLQIVVPDGAQEFYFVANEQGDTANPGTLAGFAGIGFEV